MKITVIDGGNYLRGLLLLIRKDRRIAHSEIHLMKRIGNALGYERKFCDNAIHEILENKYIVDAPPQFSSNKLAIRFDKDGLALAFSDNEAHPSEEEWLRSTAERNGLGLAWYRRVLATATNRKLHSCLEADGLTVEYACRGPLRSPPVHTREDRATKIKAVWHEIRKRDQDVHRFLA